MSLSGKLTKKQVVLMIAKRFLKYHSKAGELTNFEQKIKDKVKIHTIRGGYDLWKKKIDEVKAGKAELVLKEWSGMPYRTPQEKLFVYDQHDGIGVSKLTYEKGKLIVNDEVIISPEVLAKNDGLTLKEFEDWFKVFPAEPMAILHLTGFRYKSNKFDTI